MLPPGIFQETFLLGLSALFLSVAILTRRGQSLRRYWEIPFAFFVFTIAGAADTIFLHGFIDNVLHETSSTNNPLASTVLGTVLAQLVSTLSIVIPIILLTMASGNDLSSIFIDKARIRRGLVVSIISFLGFYVFTGLGLAQGLFPNNGITLSRFIALTPALLVLVLSNGIREELWFRGIFLKKYGKFLRPLPSNMLAAIIFTSFHIQVQYTRSLLPFLGITLILGLWLGYLMQRSGNIVAPGIFHAGSDIPIYLAFCRTLRHDATLHRMQPPSDPCRLFRSAKKPFHEYLSQARKDGIGKPKIETPSSVRARSWRNCRVQSRIQSVIRRRFSLMFQVAFAL